MRIAILLRKINRATVSQNPVVKSLNMNKQMSRKGRKNVDNLC